MLSLTSSDGSAHLCLDLCIEPCSPILIQTRGGLLQRQVWRLREAGHTHCRGQAGLHTQVWLTPKRALFPLQCHLLKKTGDEGTLGMSSFTALFSGNLPLITPSLTPSPAASFSSSLLHPAGILVGNASHLPISLGNCHPHLLLLISTLTRMEGCVSVS